MFYPFFLFKIVLVAMRVNNPISAAIPIGVSVGTRALGTSSSISVSIFSFIFAESAKKLALSAGLISPLVSTMLSKD